MYIRIYLNSNDEIFLIIIKIIDVYHKIKED